MSHLQVIQPIPRPPAGADWSFTPSSSDRVKLLSITGRLTTDATVGNRISELLVTTITGDVISADPSAVIQAASQGPLYNWRSDGPRYTTANNDNTLVMSCPDFWLPAGCVVSTNTSGLDASDQWSAQVAVYLVADELLEELLIARWREMNGTGG